MKIIKIEAYTFDELDEKAREKAIQNARDINVSDRDWYEYIYEEAKGFGLDIKEFDLYHRSIGGKLTTTVEESAKAIMNDYMSGTNIHAVAKEYLEKSKGLGGEELEELTEEYRDKLLAEYLDQLGVEYEYLQSDEVVAEILEVNEYLFTKEGERKVLL